jgi:hypothetical protein
MVREPIWVLLTRRCGAGSDNLLLSSPGEIFSGCCGECSEVELVALTLVRVLPFESGDFCAVACAPTSM